MELSNFYIHNIHKIIYQEIIHCLCFVMIILFE